MKAQSFIALIALGFIFSPSEGLAARAGGGFHGGGFHGHGTHFAGGGAPQCRPGHHFHHGVAFVRPFFPMFGYGFYAGPTYLQDAAPESLEWEGDARYYCRDPAGYYPEISVCPVPWQRITPVESAPSEAGGDRP